MDAKMATWRHYAEQARRVIEGAIGDFAVAVSTEKGMKPFESRNVVVEIDEPNCQLSVNVVAIGETIGPFSFVPPEDERPD